MKVQRFFCTIATERMDYMPKVVLVYANCTDQTASGDFSFAGNLARDLAREINRQQLNLKVTLVSTLDGVPRFEKIYGNAVNGNITIDNENISLSSLELFDAVENTVVAFIEANRCKYASADILKRILSPESKFLFVGNVNQGEIGDLFAQTLYRNQIYNTQAGLYDSFDSGDLFFGNAGIMTTQLGLPIIKKSQDLSPLNTSQQVMLPTGSYGFIYLTPMDDSRDYKLIAQYLKLSNLNHYVLVGNFTAKQNDIKLAYESDLTFVHSTQNFPQITYYQSLPNNVMRKMVGSSTDSLTLSTGVFSSLEAMQDKKLIYYQDSAINTEFVTAYLIAIKSIISSDTSLYVSMPLMIIELFTLLFSDKPLNCQNMNRTHDLLSISTITNKLIEANQKIIEQANGKLAPKLLTFICGANSTNEHVQLAYVCASLRKTGEINCPMRDQALQRAAAWGRLFELKVLIKYMSITELNLKDGIQQQTAVHWATEQKNVDCLRALIQAGASLDIGDKDGKTALHKAIVNGSREIIKLLVEAGASL